MIRKLVFISILVTLPVCLFGQSSWAIAIHGGAGNVNVDRMPDSTIEKYNAVLQEALNKGTSILSNGGSGLDAVEQVILILENSPLFNAGKGAVFTHEGRNELDASIMDGKTLNAGAVAGVTKIKNPISAARAVMEHSDHVMLSGQGALEFAQKQGLKFVDTSYFHTKRRWRSLQKALNDEKHGTVGCVVLDTHGNLFAGTSTGGMTNKRFGRIGDSPVIGAGTYANNNTCAVSSTGHGEYFIRYAVAHDISARMEYLNESLKQAASYVIQNKLVEAGGAGGIIAVDSFGNIVLEFNTSGMFRAWAASDGNKGIAIGK
jgi:beta-aspartyl-peptidase (threonine type)